MSGSRKRLTKRDYEIIGAALDFILAGENPFEDDEEDRISTEEIEAVSAKIAARS